SRRKASNSRPIPTQTYTNPGIYQHRIQMVEHPVTSDSVTEKYLGKVNARTWGCLRAARDPGGWRNARARPPSGCPVFARVLSGALRRVSPRHRGSRQFPSCLCTRQLTEAPVARGLGGD